MQWCSRYSEHNGYVQWPCDPAERLPDPPEPKRRNRRSTRQKECRVCKTMIPTFAEICRRCAEVRA